jgi:hypothetical protein
MIALLLHIVLFGWAHVNKHDPHEKNRAQKREALKQSIAANMQGKISDSKNVALPKPPNRAGEEPRAPRPLHHNQAFHNGRGIGPERYHWSVILAGQEIRSYE